MNVGPIVGRMVAPILLFVMLTYDSRNARETTWGRAFFAALLPSLVLGGVYIVLLLLYLPPNFLPARH